MTTQNTAKNEFDWPVVPVVTVANNTQEEGDAYAYDDKRIVNVHNLITNEKFQIEIKKEANVFALKAKIFEKTKISINQQQIIYKANQSLADYMLISRLNVSDDDTFKLYVRGDISQTTKTVAEKKPITEAECFKWEKYAFVSAVILLLMSGGCVPISGGLAAIPIIVSFFAVIEVVLMHYQCPPCCLLIFFLPKLFWLYFLMVGIRGVVEGYNVFIYILVCSFVAFTQILIFTLYVSKVTKLQMKECSLQ